MHKINSSIKFIVALAKTQTIVANRFDRGLGGLGFNEFLILLALDQAPEQQLRRVDLAEKIGLTASGVTRILLPMEKVHLIKSGEVEDDARVRVVALAAGGKQRLEESLDRMNEFLEEVLVDVDTKGIESNSKLLLEIGGRFLMN